MQEQTGSSSTLKKPQIEIYTAITGEKDEPRSDITVFCNCDKFNQHVMNAKIFKILSHLYVDCDISIWVDGNIKLLIPPEKLVEEWLGDADMAVWKHFDRDDVYDECDAAMGLGGATFEQIKAHKEYLESIDFPRHTGLAECNVIIRRHNDRIKNFNNAWWAEICKHSTRDQISFPKVLMENPIKVNYIEGNVRNHPYFSYKPH